MLIIPPTIKSIGFLIIFSVSVLCVGIFLSKELIEPLIHKGGYYFIYLTFFLWILLCMKRYFLKIIPIVKTHYKALVLSTILVSLIHYNFTPRFRTFSDEVNLVSISMAMYRSKTASMLQQGFLSYKYNVDYAKTLDKRPLLFPFLISIAHTLLGYNANNGILINFFIGIFILFSFHYYVCYFFPGPIGFISILIFASLPGYIFLISSSGFEALNLLFIIWVFIFFHIFVRSKDVRDLEILIVTLALLAQCRYESVVFTCIFILLVPWLIPKELYANFSKIIYSSPFLFLPIVLQRMYFVDFQQNVELNGIIQTTDKLFGFENLISNFPNNVMVFSGLCPELGFSPIVFALSLIGIYLMMRSWANTHKNSFPIFDLIFGGMSFSIILMLTFSYYWGDFTADISNRLAFVFIPYIIFTTLFTIHFLTYKKKNIRYQTLTMLCIFHIIFLWPYAHDKTHLLSATQAEYERSVDFFKKNVDKYDNILIVCERPQLYLIHEYSAVTYSFMNHILKKNEIRRLLNSFDVIYTVIRHPLSQLKEDEILLFENSFLLDEPEVMKIDFNQYIEISQLIQPME